MFSAYAHALRALCPYTHATRPNHHQNFSFLLMLIMSMRWIMLCPYPCLIGFLTATWLECATLHGRSHSTTKTKIWFWKSSCDKQFLSVRKCSIVLRVQVSIGKLPDIFCFRGDTNMKLDFSALLSTLATCYYSNKRNTFSLSKWAQTLALTNDCFMARSPQNEHVKFPRAPEARAKKFCPF